MSRKDKPFIRRVFGTISSFVLIGTCTYALFTGFNVLTGLIIGLAILSIATPVVIDGGGISELFIGIFEAFMEGLMGVIDAIASIFNF